MRRFTRLLAAIALLILTFALPAAAATTTGIGTWTPLTGSAGDYAATMQLPAKGFPLASVTSDSRAGSVGVQSGASTWFGANSPVGQKYGSSQGKPYLNLRPKADGPTTPSTTTYTFDRPTPAAGWTFVLGDIDADKVQISAVDADGNPVSAAQLGFRSTFNLCATSPKPSGCSGPEAKDLPTWSPGTAELTGNTAAADTYGASAWFEPTVSLSSLTFTFTQRSGFPVYQTWFASIARDIGGTVDVMTNPGGTCSAAGASVVLLDADGNQVDSTHTDSSGAYSFTGFTAAPGYRVELATPDGCVPVGPSAKTVDLTTADGLADFSLREVQPALISGHVRTADGDPLDGVTVTIDGPGGPRTTTTDADGLYAFDGNAEGTYALSIDVPDGYSQTKAPADVVVPPDSEVPIPDNDFTVAPFPDITGTVTGGVDPLGGVVVVLVDDGGNEVDRATTAPDGTYRFTRITSGDYSVSIPDPPGEYRTPAARDLTLGDDDSTGNDFALTRPGSIAGTVTNVDTGDPVPGITVTLTGPGGTHTTATTDDSGNYFFGELDNGTYGVTVTAPAGTDVVGPSTRMTTITDAGENVAGQDFGLEPEDSTPPTTPPTTGEPGSGSGSGSGGELPDSGGPAATFLLAGIGLLCAGIVVVGTQRARKTE